MDIIVKFNLDNSDFQEGGTLNTYLISDILTNAGKRIIKDWITEPDSFKLYDNNGNTVGEVTIE